jgi:hypothetical protein
MTIKVLSLGSVGSAAAGILISDGTNATPIVATIGAGHGLKNGDRITISGVTGNTAMNGDWELEFTAATTVKLLGSVGNGTTAGTIAVAVLCDRTPFLPNYSVAGHIGNTSGAAVLVGTVLIEGSGDNSTFATALATGQEAIPAATAGIGMIREVKLSKYMRFRASAWTSGNGNCVLMS